MNNMRRKEICKVIAEIYNLQDKVEELLSEEEEYMDNIPENLQNSERYYRAEESVEYLTSASDSISEIIDNLESAMWP